MYKCRPPTLRLPSGEPFGVPAFAGMTRNQHSLVVVEGGYAGEFSAFEVLQRRAAAGGDVGEAVLEAERPDHIGCRAAAGYRIGVLEVGYGVGESNTPIGPFHTTVRAAWSLWA